MAVFIRAKRVCGPLDEKVKAQLRDESPMAAEYEADPFFSFPIHAFLTVDEDSEDKLSPFSDDDSDSEDIDIDCDIGDRNNSSDYYGTAIRDILQSRDAFLCRLHSRVVEIAKSLKGLRPVTAKLRESGYDAGICKSRWESSGGSLIAGSYEYIDVVVDEKRRYIVDLGFAAEFEVARATEEYEKLLEVMPRVMVGRSESVRELVRVMSDAARESLKRNELEVPPWRKRRYMIAKWLGPYRRAIGESPESGVPVVRGEMSAKCRTVNGFEEAVAMRFPSLATRAG